ncbi:unnamed protein product, partial [Prorocentrum cordatum]
ADDRFRSLEADPQRLAATVQQGASGGRPRPILLDLDCADAAIWPPVLKSQMACPSEGTTSASDSWGTGAPRRLRVGQTAAVEGRWVCAWPTCFLNVCVCCARCTQLMQRGDDGDDLPRCPWCRGPNFSLAWSAWPLVSDQFVRWVRYCAASAENGPADCRAIGAALSASSATAGTPPKVYARIASPGSLLPDPQHARVLVAPGEGLTAADHDQRGMPSGSPRRIVIEALPPVAAMAARATESAFAAHQGSERGGPEFSAERPFFNAGGLTRFHPDDLLLRSRAARKKRVRGGCVASGIVSEANRAAVAVRHVLQLLAALAHFDIDRR